MGIVASFSWTPGFQPVNRCGFAIFTSPVKVNFIIKKSRFQDIQPKIHRGCISELSYNEINHIGQTDRFHGIRKT